MFREKNNLFLSVDIIYFYLFLSFTFYPEMIEDPAAHVNVYAYNTIAFSTGNLYDIDLLRLCHKCSKFDFFYDTSIRCTIYSFFLLKEYLIYFYYFSACID